MNGGYRLFVDGHELRVLDDVIFDGEIEALYRFLAQAPFVRIHTDRAAVTHAAAPPAGARAGSDEAGPDRYACFLPPATRRHPLLRRLDRAVRAVFPRESLVRTHLYANYAVYGDMVYPHRDCAPGARNVTALVYVNPRWQRDWGGETLFFEGGGDAVHAVTARPGRICVFRGAIPHRVGLPQRDCYEPRLALVMKYASRRRRRRRPQ